MATCEQCGTSIRGNAAFCPRCGNAVARDEKTTQIKTEQSDTGATVSKANVFGYAGMAFAAIAVILTLVQPWVVAKTGTGVASKLVSLFAGQGYALEPSYAIWQFADLGNVVKLYASSIGVEGAEKIPLLFVLMSVAWAAGIVLFAMGAYRYLTNPEHPMSKAVWGLAILAAAIRLAVSQIDSYSFFIVRPATLDWAFYAAIAGVIAFGLAYFAHVGSKPDED